MQSQKQKNQPQNPRKRQNKSIGNIGEQVAVKLLKNQGYKILETNYKTNFAELDIVAIDGDTLVFVEVKSRRTTRFGQPEEAVNARKFHKIGQAGQQYVMEHKSLPKKHRIDVVSIILDGDKFKSAKLIKVT
jgi:putative endonuclease